MPHFVLKQTINNQLLYLILPIAGPKRCYKIAFSKRGTADSTRNWLDKMENSKKKIPEIETAYLPYNIEKIEIKQIQSSNAWKLSIALDPRLSPLPHSQSTRSNILCLLADSGNGEII